MLLTHQLCEVSCPNYKKYTVIFFSPTLLEVHWDMCSSRHPEPERSDGCPTPKPKLQKQLQNMRTELPGMLISALIYVYFMSDLARFRQSNSRGEESI